MRFSAFALPLALLAPLAPVAPAWAETSARTITVTGEGQVSAVPDMATVTLGVMSDADTACYHSNPDVKPPEGAMEQTRDVIIAGGSLYTVGEILSHTGN